MGEGSSIYHTVQHLLVYKLLFLSQNNLSISLSKWQSLVNKAYCIYMYSFVMSFSQCSDRTVFNHFVSEYVLLDVSRIRYILQY
jgi:hypothetical protein